MGLLLSAVAAWVGGWWWGRRRRSDGAARLRRGGSFVVVMALVGPLLVVNGLLKEHWGRARPADIAAFGGTRIYTPPLEPAAQCDSNCAFVSGHASAGFSFMALGWVFRHPALMAFGTAFGSLAGLGRMAQGDHFLSDVVFSFWVVYFCCVAVAHRWFGTSRIRRGEQEGVKRWDRLTASA